MKKKCCFILSENNRDEGWDEVRGEMREQETKYVRGWNGLLFTFFLSISHTLGFLLFFPTHPWVTRLSHFNGIFVVSFVSLFFSHSFAHTFVNYLRKSAIFLICRLRGSERIQILRRFSLFLSIFSLIHFIRKIKAIGSYSFKSRASFSH